MEKILKNTRLYGKPPYSVAVLHGGPGAQGTMASVANGIKDEFSVIEPLQTADTVMGQVEELNDQLHHFSAPFVLIGHSWGAWLAWIFACIYPQKVKHIIMVGCPPFEASYAKDIMLTRLNNFEKKDKAAIAKLLGKLKNNKITDDEFARLGSLIEKADTYSAIKSPFEEAPLPMQTDIFNKVWTEAKELRATGKLLAMKDKIHCKVTFLHGKDDPHPYQGVQDVLNEHEVDFEFVLLDKCGHSPWKEEHRWESFFKLLKLYIKE